MKHKPGDYLVHVRSPKCWRILKVMNCDGEYYTIQFQDNNEIKSNYDSWLDKEFRSMTEIEVLEYKLSGQVPTYE